jgi:hypothetical protein
MAIRRAFRHKFRVKLPETCRPLNRFACY